MDLASVSQNAYPRAVTPTARDAFRNKPESVPEAMPRQTEVKIKPRQESKPNTPDTRATAGDDTPKFNPDRLSVTEAHSGADQNDKRQREQRPAPLTRAAIRDAMSSYTGKQANQHYLDTANGRQGKVIDEII